MTKKPIIEIEKVNKIFRVKSQDVLVLKDINVTINDGDFTIIFGPSGCGKSTLLHIILGLEEQTSGKAVFLNRNIYDYDEDERSEFRKRNIGMIYQQPNWIRSLSVIENVAFVSSMSGANKIIAQKKAREMLELVGMLEWADYFPSELSSGQQQKISLARALITDPKVIIADEPTGNLDHRSGIDLMNLFQKLSKEGKTIIMVTHDINNIDYANSVIQMFDGRVVKVHDLFKNKSAEVKKIISNSIPLEEEVIPHKINNTIVSELPKINFLKNISWKRIKFYLNLFFSNLFQILTFLSLLVIYLFQKLIVFFSRRKFIPSIISKKILVFSSFLSEKVFPKFERKSYQTISRLDLIDLSLKNMMVRKIRTFITIGGMAIGIGLIVFLVSVGYGLEKLVISRVARLDEMKQIDTSPAIASNIKINDKILASFKDIPNIKKVLPVIGVVGKVNFNNSVSDIVVYGVMADYLKESAIKPIRGTVFASNDLNTKIKGFVKEETGEVAGVSTDINVGYLNTLGSIEFSIDPEKFIRVRESPDTNSKIIGYTRRVEGTQWGNEVFGRFYSDSQAGDMGEDENGQKLGLWIKSKVFLWENKSCDQSNPSCEDGKYIPLIDQDNSHIQKEGYFAEINVNVKREFITGEVLGISSDEATSTANLNFIDISALEATPAGEKVTKVELPPQDKREVIVNKAFLKVLGLDENKALDKTVNLSFIVTGDLADQDEKITSESTEYTIIGITSDSKTPIAYVPIIDLKQMGIVNYSQVKLVTIDQTQLAKARKQVEALGFKTNSVVDTVTQIEQLFSTLQFVLGILGVVALSVAALGMFNTLTVSLLERTREVGTMKAMGMKSFEVRDLFLTESMIMGLYGGLGGLFLGFSVGKIFSAILSIFSLTKGVGLIDIVFIPFAFIIFIIFISVSVGIITGIYPSHRATKISALNALRYE